LRVAPRFGIVILNVRPLIRGVAIRAPAKLNLFLELLARRVDGYHDIDTVMVPIDCRDTIVIRPSPQDSIQIATHWWPSREHWLETLGQPQADVLIDIPSDDRNLIHRAIVATAALSGLTSGFEVDVRKRIPAGAGMGGASSDAAAAIRGIAKLGGIDASDPRLWQIAAQIGSDVPFFLGCQPRETSSTLTPRITAMRATGRGEKLTEVPLTKPLHFIIAYPATSLSTGNVYGKCVVPPHPTSADRMVEALAAGEAVKIGKTMTNRLSDSAFKISAMVRDLLEQMWRCDLPRCQLTGSGSACFSLLDNFDDADLLVSRLRTRLRSTSLNAQIIRAKTISIPQRVHALQ